MWNDYNLYWSILAAYFLVAYPSSGMVLIVLYFLCLFIVYLFQPSLSYFVWYHAG